MMTKQKHRSRKLGVHILICKQAERDTLRMEGVSSDTPCLTKLHILILPNVPISSSNGGPSIQAYQPMEAILILPQPLVQLSTNLLCTLTLYINSPLGPIIVAHMCLVWGQLLGYGQPTGDHISKDKWISLSQVTSTHDFLAGMGPCGSFPNPMLEFWLS